MRHDQTFEVPREPGPLEAVGGPLLFAAGFLGLVGLITARTRNDIALTSEERERLAFEDDRSDFDEWINAIELPPEVRDLPRAEAKSLGDLVDFAIDTDNSVIENPDSGVYYVVHDGNCYTYEPPSAVETEDSSEDDAVTGAGGGETDDTGQ